MTGDAPTRYAARMRATIVYHTARQEPRLDWVIDDLARQALPSDELELVVVDALGRAAREIGFREIPAIVSLIETTPKPTPWQGPQRVTSRDWWAISNARNTGAVLCGTDYLAFLDDRCHLGPGWLAAVRRGEWERRSVVAGSYTKEEDGGRVSVDHRLQAFPDGRQDCGGGWLYGCTFALPLAWYLDVNGHEEGCDGLSGEDYILGLMLANRGHRIDFRPELFTLQDRSSRTIHGYARRDKGVSPRDKSHAAIDRFGRRTRTEFTPDLRALRGRIDRGEGFPGVDHAIEHRDWYDGQPLREIEMPA